MTPSRDGKPVAAGEWFDMLGAWKAEGEHHLESRIRVYELAFAALTDHTTAYADALKRMADVYRATLKAYREHWDKEV